MHIGIYQTVKVIKDTKEKKIALVLDQVTHTYFIERTIKNGYMEIYKQLLGVDNGYWPIVVEIQGNRAYEQYIDAPKLSEVEKGNIDFIIQLCDALSILHAMDPPIIHRDIKPDNIFIDHERAILFDFDIARNVVLNQSQDTELLGSVGYAAPEQYGFGQSDQRTDIYAIGILLKEIDVQGEYLSVSKKATSMDPKNRYQSILELKDDLNHEDRWVVPGVNDLNWKSRIRSWLFIVFMIAVTMQGQVSKNEIPILYQFVMFLFMYGILFLWNNRKRWPQKNRFLRLFLYYFVFLFILVGIYTLIKKMML